MHMHLTEVWRVWRAMEFISPSSLFHVQSFLPVEVISYFLYHIIYPLPPPPYFFTCGNIYINDITDLR